MKMIKQIRKYCTWKYMRWPVIIAGSISFISFIGFFFILYGGRLIVKDEQLILKQTTTIETLDGTTIYELYDENRIYIDIDQIPSHVIDAFVAIEDARFFRHEGVDLRSIFRALYRDLIAMEKVEGASTITQQLIKNLFLTHDKTFLRKTKEMMASLYLEQKFSKDEILELYLNAIYFGHGVYGIEKAAQQFFSKSARELSLAEGALLASLPKSPHQYSPFHFPDKAMERRNLVLLVMEQQGYISLATRLDEQGKTLGIQPNETTRNLAYDSYIDLVLKEAQDLYHLSFEELKRGGYRIIVPLDEKLQQIAFQKFQEQQFFPGNEENVEAAFVILNKDEGTIVSALGGRSYELGNLNRLLVPRQPGSIMKPIAVYGPALMLNSYHPYSLLMDEPFYEGDYQVKNADGVYEGEISLYEALMQSKNTSAVWLLQKIGIPYAKSYLEEMNIFLPDEGLAIALGGLHEGLTPIEVAAAYQTIANHGEYIEPAVIEKIYNRGREVIGLRKQSKREVFSKQVSWDLTKMLLTTVESGTANAGDFHKELAGKTGSTEHPRVANMFKDAWFAGYTPDYALSLWTGYDISDENHYLTGGSAYPTKLVKEILSEYDKHKSLTAVFQKPEDIIDLEEPIQLGKITGLDAKIAFGGLTIVKGVLKWDKLEDERIVYRIYEQTENETKQIGEVIGANVYEIKRISIFRPSSYFVVAYDPLTNREGEPSESVSLTFRN